MAHPDDPDDPDERVRVPRRGLALPDPRAATTGADEFGRLAALAGAAEATGFDSVWVADGPPPAGVERPGGESVFEPYSLLGALAVRTQRVALAVLPDGPTSRRPSIVAKVVTGVDVIAHGRAVLALGVGPASDAEAAGRLAEELQICRALLVEDAPTFVGAYHQIVDAPNRPRPVHAAGPALVVAADRPEVLDPVARYADALVVAGDAAAVGRMARALDSACDAVGRPRDGVVVLWSGTLDPRADGGADRLEEELRSLAEAGADGFVVDLGEADGPEAVARAGEVLGRVAARTGG